MTPLELLAPAKNLECGIAAIDHGADAVYIGAPRFGARVSAGNSVDDIRQLCHYAHQFDVKVYVTVNTIVYDDELSATEMLIQQLHEACVDAILVQDMGILKMNIPSIALHASTQTDNRSADKVRWLRDVGFRRVVLARELSVDEIANIHAQVHDIPLEVFVHGALCVSYSGLCYASQHCFGRSANRGACAQVCRHAYDAYAEEPETTYYLQDQDHDIQLQIDNKYIMSPKDLKTIHFLNKMVDAGVEVFKIEGRARGPEYVKTVVGC